MIPGSVDEKPETFRKNLRIKCFPRADESFLISNQVNETQLVLCPPTLVIDENTRSRADIENLPSPYLSMNSAVFHDPRRPSIYSPRSPRSARRSIKKVDIFEKIKIKKIEEGRNSILRKLPAFVQSKTFKVIKLIFTIYSLVVYDMKIMVALRTVDYLFDSITVISIGLFLLETFAGVYKSRHVICSFFFLLDMLATSSLALELSFVDDCIFSITRAGQFLILLRMIRILKLFRGFSLSLEPAIKTAKRKLAKSTSINEEDVRRQLSEKYHSMGFENKKSEPQSQNFELPEPAFNEEHSPDNAAASHKDFRLGKKLAESTTQRVLILVFILLLCMPLFNSEYHFDHDPSFEFQLRLIARLSQRMQQASDEVVRAEMKGKISSHFFKMLVKPQEDVSAPVLFAKIPSLASKPLIDYWPHRFDLRRECFESYTIKLKEFEEEFSLVVDFRQKALLLGAVSILKTVFVCLVLVIGAYYFKKDVKNIALSPLERMINRINLIAANPLSSKDLELRQEKAEGNMETIFIENSLAKLCALLALGFGEAGTEIIAQNMANMGDLDPLIQGQKIFAIFGFCDIRNFTDATEVLQEEVMVFVNTIAYIVHNTVDKYQGAANKNIGDAFLLVWQLENVISSGSSLGENPALLLRTKFNKITADLALLSFLKIIKKLNSNRSILQYNKNKALGERIPGYCVRMGFGLHAGWAIEGAIGSVYKIDASYLSPNVNVASRLEAATKQYGKMVLMSGCFIDLLSKRVASLCREIDRVTLKGSNQPMRLYTIDFVPARTKISEKEFKYLSKSERAYKRILVKSLILEFIMTKQVKTFTLFESDKDISDNLINQSEKIFKAFKHGFLAYIEGDWVSSSQVLQEQLEDDPPSKALYDYMKLKGFRCPEDWMGYRELTEK